MTVTLALCGGPALCSLNFLGGVTVRLTFENDEEGLCGNPCEQWLIRDLHTDNKDIVAAVPKTGDEEYDNDYVYPLVRSIALMPEMQRVLAEVQEDMACDGTVSDATMDAIREVLGYRVLADFEKED